MRTIMKKAIVKSIIVSGMLMLALPAFAADYSGYSAEELAAMRGNMRNATTQEREAFRNAWRDKTQSPSPEDRRSLKATNSNNGSGNRYGSGSGGGFKKCGGGSGSCDGTGRGGSR
jgi:uncharacterized membrane protein YgcG